MKRNALARWTPPALVTVPWLERKARQHRRERVLRYMIALAAIVLPSVVARVVIGWAAGL